MFFKCKKKQSKCESSLASPTLWQTDEKSKSRSLLSSPYMWMAAEEAERRRRERYGEDLPPLASQSLLDATEQAKTNYPKED